MQDRSRAPRLAKQPTHEVPMTTSCGERRKREDHLRSCDHTQVETTHRPYHFTQLVCSAGPASHPSTCKLQFLGSACSQEAMRNGCFCVRLLRVSFCVIVFGTSVVHAVVNNYPQSCFSSRFFVIIRHCAFDNGFR